MPDEGAYAVVQAARGAGKLTGREIISQLFEHFFELHGDRAGSDDPAIVGGLATFQGRPVTVITTERGTTVAERVATHFGSPMPGGYRKAQRLMQQASKFHRPVICLVNTAGAFPGQAAEENGQGAAIATTLLQMSQIACPVMTVIYGEGGSGGALALAAGDQVWMLTKSTYAILSPEGFATILWKDSSRAAEAAELMQMTPAALKRAGVIDGIIKEDADHQATIARIGQVLATELPVLAAQPVASLLAQRQARFRKF